jgi:catechol 2,3-dioxygenase-like lactoylglutathione lyase family enzyme
MVDSAVPVKPAGESLRACFEECGRSGSAGIRYHAEQRPHSAALEHSMPRIISGVLLVLTLSGCAAAPPRQPAPAPPTGDAPLRLGNFSVSLAVKDIAASRAFYEKLGFSAIGGDQGQNWLIMQNETSTIGLFQGMFDKNLLTFNPGWDRNAKQLADFDDVRELQRALQARGLTLSSVADESSTSPASLMLIDPDGNPILLDQHVPKPAR